MPLLTPPDDLTSAALKRLRADEDFARVVGWLARALATRDAANRPMIDGVQLRMGQGAAICLDEIIGHAQGTGRQGVLADTRVGRLPQSDTAGGASRS